MEQLTRLVVTVERRWVLLRFRRRLYVTTLPCGLWARPGQSPRLACPRFSRERALGEGRARAAEESRTARSTCIERFARRAGVYSSLPTAGSCEGGEEGGTRVHVVVEPDVGQSAIVPLPLPGWRRKTSLPGPVPDRSFSSLALVRRDGQHASGDSMEALSAKISQAVTKLDDAKMDRAAQHELYKASGFVMRP